jgi:hypothetical protein
MITDTTIKEMISEGWKPRTINGVRVLQLGTLLCQNHKAEYWWADSMFDVADKLGRPDKIHTANGQVTTIEYFVLEETA